ncbi:aminotransferase class I/II-fold pyridoxal phosphate-dependent enzyme [Corynebacterium variabile]|uniref:Transcriptional regulators containing a DNA-binding HTH domain and an aminotransferase domain (MocR family) and their eukaryotic orthologs n=2 Tax=Corynebacterium variabile TaxID=1727 RepID=A0A0X2NK35_9CORY|nr:aminotransferase class I/II-fold pyridoxal phosphate-dependent enzyme [Corynebacterium variabile]AEK37870.1 aspartate aminotransferase [Corynebacterium variabile DSM 44702]CUU65108.1 Transcriptional regulators containing a DNA-binding HTH domain and an aminotransferase domain (MocR family) and their eukaryotic orthologs [Corynebacterium variabile]
MKLTEANTDRLLALKDEVTASYEELKARNLGLNLTRGKPSSEQLDIGESLLSLPGEDDHTLADGTDVRNYGGGDGIREIRELWAEVLGIPADLVVAGDASSLNIMFDLISWSHTFGNNDSERPWAAEETVKWICPVPGYDRHFSITETFGYEMVTIPMNEDGPDVDAIRELVKDPQVKGMWVVPVFSNPTGATVSREVAEALASMETAAPDFRIIWDNAYAVHTLTDEFPEILDIVGIAAEAGNPNRFWAMSSTSKITLAGAGVAFFNSSKENLDWYRKYATIRGIGPNKVNQLAHVRYFGNAEGVRSVMRKHSGILGPKFRAVTEILEKRLGGLGIAGWTHPAGGYFISVDLLDGTAKRTVELAKEAGIALTGAGSAFPLKNDPNNRNLRLAPSLPPQEEVEVAMDGVATCMLFAAIEAAEAAGAAE